MGGGGGPVSLGSVLRGLPKVSELNSLKGSEAEAQGGAVEPSVEDG